MEGLGWLGSFLSTEVATRAKKMPEKGELKAAPPALIRGVEIGTMQAAEMIHKGFLNAMKAEKDEEEKDLIARILQEIIEGKKNLAVIQGDN